jgi:hypothetical protein
MVPAVHCSLLTDEQHGTSNLLLLIKATGKNPGKFLMMESAAASKDPAQPEH